MLKYSKTSVNTHIGDSLGFGDVAGQTPQTPGGFDCAVGGTGVGAFLWSSLCGVSAGQPGQLQGPREYPLHGPFHIRVLH